MIWGLLVIISSPVSLFFLSPASPAPLFLTISPTPTFTLPPSLPFPSLFPSPSPSLLTCRYERRDLVALAVQPPLADVPGYVVVPYSMHSLKRLWRRMLIQVRTNTRAIMKPIHVSYFFPHKPIYRYHRDASGEAGVGGQGYSDTEELGVEGGYEENWRKGT